MKRYFFAASALLLLAAGPSRPTLLDEQGWTLQDEALAHRLTHMPGECLIKSADAALARKIEIGRAVFRSPATLGGPAARLGLSCNACHQNGHANTGFFLPELTDKPGAADVTAEWASAVRGDGTMNPMPIPDLTGVGTRTAFGHKKEPSLSRFVRSVIEEEFQGEALPQEAFDGLLAYLRALDPKACPGAETTLTLQDTASDVRQPLTAAEKAEPQTKQLLILSAQEEMGRIAERLPQPRFVNERKTLETLARELGAMRTSEAMPSAGWNARFDEVVAALMPREGETYFDEATLRAAEK